MSARFFLAVCSVALIVAIAAVAVTTVKWADAKSDYAGLEEKHFVLENKYYGLDHPLLLEEKEREVKELETDFNVKLVDGEVLWGFPEVDIVHKLFKYQLPWQVSDYFRHPEAKPLSIEIMPKESFGPRRVVYEPCRNTIQLSEDLLRRDMIGFPDYEQFQRYVSYRMGDAYDRVRGEVENDGFDCSDKSTWFFANSDYYRGLGPDKEPEPFGSYFLDYMQDELEDGPWCVRKRCDDWAPQSAAKYEFMRAQVFCGERDRILQDRFTSYSDLMHSVSLDAVDGMDTWGAIRAETGPGRFCNLHYVFDDYQ